MTVLPKLIATDIDGVWTDGGMYYTESGDEFKRFNTYDSAAVNFCMHLGIPVAIITGEASLAVKKGGEGVFREFVEDILAAGGVLQQLLDKHYLKGN